MHKLRQLRKIELSKVAEVADRNSWLTKTLNGKVEDKAKLLAMEEGLRSSKLSENDLKVALKGGLLTYLLHW